MKILHVASFNGNIGDFANHSGFRKCLNNYIGEQIEYTNLEIREFYKSWNLRKFDNDFVDLANQFDLLVFGGGNFFEMCWDYSSTGTTIDLSEEILKKSNVLSFLMAWVLMIKMALLAELILKNSISIWDLGEHLPRDVTVIIVAAGPSLTKNVDLLKLAKGKSIIMAVDRAYETLIDHGIEPDFVVLLDPRKPLSYCGNRKGFKTPLLCKLEGSPEIMVNHKGKKVIYDQVDYITNIYNLLNKKFYNIGNGGSVTTAAFSICANLGFERIAFIGLDLAFQGEQSHSGNIQEINQNIFNEFLVDDIEGNKVRTRDDWYAFLNWFELVITQLTDIEVIDATEGGAKIAGTRIMTLQEVINKYCNKSIDCMEVINNTKEFIDEHDYTIIKEFLDSNLTDMIEIKQLSYKVINKIKNSSKKNEGKLLKYISEINGKIEKMPIFSLINDYLLSEEATTIQAMYFMTKNQKKDEENTYYNIMKIYTTMIEACDFLEPKINEARKCFLS